MEILKLTFLTSISLVGLNALAEEIVSPKDIIELAVNKQRKAAYHEAVKQIQNAKNDTSQFEFLLIAINRGVFAKGQISLNEVEFLFGKKLEKKSNNNYSVRLETLYAFYDDYEKKEQVLKGKSYWLFTMNFNNKSLLTDCSLSIEK